MDGLLTAPRLSGKAPAIRVANLSFQSERGRKTIPFQWVILSMIKPEWGTKRTCPKCATRFYDLTKDDPVTCINCGNAWMPEPVLKSKQPMPFEQLKPGEAEPETQTQSADTDLDLDVDVDDDNVSPDNDVDLGDDDDLGVDTGDDKDDEN